MHVVPIRWARLSRLAVRLAAAAAAAAAANVVEGVTWVLCLEHINQVGAASLKASASVG